MPDELIDLHQDILEEFETRVEENEAIPGEVLEEMQKFESLALGEDEDLRQAIRDGSINETT